MDKIKVYVEVSLHCLSIIPELFLYFYLKLYLSISERNHEKALFSFKEVDAVSKTEQKYNFLMLSFKQYYYKNRGFRLVRMFVHYPNCELSACDDSFE